MVQIGKNHMEKWKMLTPAKRVQYIWNYYKLPIVIGLILLYIVIYTFYRNSGKKDVILYTALVNVAPGEAFCETLSDKFLEYAQADQKKEAFTLYKGLYLTDDESNEQFQYTYASQMKILAAIDDEQLDVVLADKEAFEAFAQNGYLYDLDTFFMDADLKESLESFFVEGMEILEDNAKEAVLDPDVEYQAVTKKYPMALDLSGFSLFQDAGFQDTVYLCVIANTPRQEQVEQYIRYLFGS